MLTWTVIIICTVFCAMISFIKHKEAIIISTSFFGSYLCMRGISLYAGGFPNEYIVIH